MIIVAASGGSDLVDGVLAIEAALKAGSSFHLMTSGTTGAPKRIPNDLRSSFGKKRGGVQDERWLLCYSPSRWAGVSVVLHALKAGCTLCVPRSTAFPDLLSGMQELSPTHLSCTPSLFRNIVRMDELGALASTPLKQVTFGGEAATQSVLDLASSIWPSARVSHVYASTEHGDVCAVSDGLAGVPQEKFSRFRFTDDGELIIGGVATGDLWELSGGRYLFRGRREEMINVGGNKVSPLVVEEFALRQGADCARAFGVSTALMGSLVALEYCGGPDERALALLYRAAFPKFACPASLKKVNQIAMTNAGKTKRISP